VGSALPAGVDGGELRRRLQQLAAVAKKKDA
jgi:hypothetical protein